MSKKTISIENVIQQIADTLAQFDGETIEELANRILDSKVKYIDDSTFEQDVAEVLAVVHGDASESLVKRLEGIAGHTASSVNVIGDHTEILFHERTQADAERVSKLLEAVDEVDVAFTVDYDLNVQRTDLDD